MKEEEIRDILNSHQICFAQHGTLCATVKAGIGAYQNGLGEIMHTMKDHILHINAQGIAILAVDDINGAPQEHTLLFLPHEDIVSTTIKIKLLHFLFTIETRRGPSCTSYIKTYWHHHGIKKISPSFCSMHLLHRKKEAV